MITIGVGYVMRGIVTMVPGWGTETYTLPTPFGNSVVRIGGAVLAVEQLAVIAMTAALCALLYVFFRYTKLGVAMQATSQNQLAAYYMGIPVRRVNMLIWGCRRPWRRSAASCSRRSRSCIRTWASSASRLFRRRCSAASAACRARSSAG